MPGRNGYSSPTEQGQASAYKPLPYAPSHLLQLEDLHQTATVCLHLALHHLPQDLVTLSATDGCGPGDAIFPQNVIKQVLIGGDEGGGRQIGEEAIPILPSSAYNTGRLQTLSRGIGGKQGPAAGEDHLHHTFVLEQGISISEHSGGGVLRAHGHPHHAHSMLQNKKRKPIDIFIIILVVVPLGVAVKDKGVAQAEKGYKFFHSHRKMKCYPDMKASIQQSQQPADPHTSIGLILQQPPALF